MKKKKPSVADRVAEARQVIAKRGGFLASEQLPGLSETAPNLTAARQVLIRLYLLARDRNPETGLPTPEEINEAEELFVNAWLAHKRKQDWIGHILALSRLKDVYPDGLFHDG